MSHPQTPKSGNESPGYYILVEDSSTQTTERDFFILEQTRDATTQTEEEEFVFSEPTRDASIQTSEEENGSLVYFISEESNFDVKSETSEEKRKRKISKEEDTDPHKRSRPEVYEMSDQVVSYFSDNPCKASDSRTDQVIMSSQIVSDSGSLACIHSEFSNYKKSNLKSQESKAFNYVGKEGNLSTGPCSSYNKDIFQKENAICEITDDYFDKVANFSAHDDGLELWGKSNCNDDKSYSKTCVGKVQNVSPLIQQPPEGTKREQLRCLLCHKTVSEHVKVHEGKDKFKCCICDFMDDNFSYLQIHAYNLHDRRPFFCNACQIKYSLVGTHEPHQTCDECNQKFECKYQLEQHYFSEHKKEFETLCRICKNEFDEHFIKEVREYQCCFRECRYQQKMKYLFIRHLHTHFPLKLYECEVCGNHFKHLKSQRQHLQEIHSSCVICEKWFVNIHFLYKHHREEHREE